MIKSCSRNHGLLLGVALLAGLGMSGTALAAAGYCNTSYGGATIQTDGLAVTDATFDIGATSYTADDCYGIVDTGSSNVANNLTYVNNLAWVNFVNGVKDDIGGGSNSVTVDSILYTLTTTTNTGTGTNTFQNWTLSWADTNGAANPNLPATIDFAVQWNGGNQDVFYLFDNVVLPSSPTSGNGSIDIKVMNNPGNADLGTSHMSVFFTDATSDGGGGGGGVPEPATAALLGLSLLAGGLFRRKRVLGQ